MIATATAKRAKEATFAYDMDAFVTGGSGFGALGYEDVF